MTVLTMDIVTMELASVVKVSLELIVLSPLVQMIVSLVENVLITPVFALQDGHTSIVPLNFAPMTAVETVIA